MLAHRGSVILPAKRRGVSVRALRTGDRFGYTPIAMSRTRKVLNVYHGSQLRLASYTWYDAGVPGYPHQVLVCLGEAEDGRLVCTGLVIDPKENLEIPSRLLRDIRLGDFVTFAASAAKVVPVGRVLGATRHRVRRSRPGPDGYPAKFYKDVAGAYRDAVRSHPRTPVLRLMSELRCSEATAHRYLNRCRELGLLDPRKAKGKTRS
jgi:hypothetical protein